MGGQRAPRERISSPGTTGVGGQQEPQKKRMAYPETAAAIEEEEQRNMLKPRTTMKTSFGENSAFNTATKSLTAMRAAIPPPVPAKVEAKEKEALLVAGGGPLRAAGGHPPQTAEGRPCVEGVAGAGGGGGAISMPQLDQNPKSLQVLLIVSVSSMNIRKKKKLYRLTTAFFSTRLRRPYFLFSP